MQSKRWSPLDVIHRNYQQAQRFNMTSRRKQARPIRMQDDVVNLSTESSGMKLTTDNNRREEVIRLLDENGMLN